MTKRWEIDGRKYLADPGIVGVGIDGSKWRHCIGMAYRTAEGWIEDGLFY